MTAKARQKKVFIGVDIQNDFANADGALYVKNENIGEKINDFLIDTEGDYDRVIFTRDFHPRGHVSFASEGKGGIWPDHCINGTPGAEIVDDIAPGLINIIVNKGQDANYDSYSGIKDDNGRLTGLDKLLDKDTDVYVTGLAFDYCVKFTAIDLVPYVKRVIVVKPLTASVDPSKDEENIKELTDKGVIVLENTTTFFEE